MAIILHESDVPSESTGKSEEPCVRKFSERLCGEIERCLNETIII